MSTHPRFKYFSEIAPPEGASGWERMYPYFLRSQPALEEQENQRFWFPDTIHWVRACSPFDSIGAEAVYLGAGQASARIFAIPTAKGLDLRMMNGYVYVSSTPVTDPAEVQERLALFEERATHYYENWEEIYAQWREKIGALVAEMGELRFDAMPKYEPEATVFERRGRSESWQVVENYHRLIDSFFVLWQYHFEMINLGYGGFLTFFQFCKEAFPNISDQTVAQMVSGIDIVAFRPDEELRRLAARAIELDLADLIVDRTEVAEIVAALEATEAGRTWLADYRAAADPWFDYFSEYGFTHQERTWNQDPSLAYAGIRRYIARLRAGENLDRGVDALLAERDRIVDGYRELLDPERQAQFDSILTLARTVYPHIEEHNIYVEHWGHAVFWQKVRELADFLVDAGVFADAEDFYLLNRFEIDQVLSDVMSAWAIGIEPRGISAWRAEVVERRKIMEALVAAPAVPAIGTPPDHVTDPLAVMNYGVTTALVNEWLAGESSDGSELTGIPASPGVAEGRVRILTSGDDLDAFEPGEVLVAPITAPSWAPAFSHAAAVVTDSGGMMSHAAIVCREYDLPAVVGSGYATTKLRTGQRVRVDGRTGVVTLLSEDGEE